MKRASFRKVLASALPLAVALPLACSGKPGAPFGDGGAPDAPDAADAAGPFSPGDGGAPDAAASGLTTLRIHYPAGTHTVAVRGNAAPLNWNGGVPMTAGAADTYEYSLTLPASVPEVEWKPLLDDSTWSQGPNYVARRGETVDAYPYFFTQKGSVSQLFAAFHSTALGNDRVVWVYLPPSYGENTRASYPVLYMHDGQNLFDSQPTFGPNGWKVDEALDQGAADGSIRELIVVAPENAGVDREYEYTPNVDPSEGKSGGGDLYLKMLVEELKPQVDAMLRSQPGRSTTGVLGSSLGGLISAYAGVTKAATYGIVGALSPSSWWDNDMIVGEVKASGKLRPDRVYVDCGQGDADDQSDTDLLNGAYLAIGYVEGTDYHYLVQPGGQHNESYWAMRLPGGLRFLFGPRQP